MDIFIEVIKLLLIDAIFIGIVAAALVPLAVYRAASFAVLKRNFIGYFSNPTGYVFVCLFVFLSSLAAFWPHDFFNRNLANLEQLNSFLPYIMLVFIPAITMSIWAEERRQGTDELLLTLPADDFDIVFGKYLAAGAIFTAALLFSTLCNHFALSSLSLGKLDTGLLVVTYLGYWLLGLAMLSIGMVASFLTSNLTVGFVLGSLFNAPLVFSSQADAIVAGPAARTVANWSLGSQFSDSFGRGIVSLSASIYFVVIIVAGLYLSMVLIGRRHWVGGKDGSNMFGHFLARTAAIIIIGIGAAAFFSTRDLVRADMTKGAVSSLSSSTREILRDLDAAHQIQVDAYISVDVPESYVQTKYDLVSMLKELRSAGKNIKVEIHELEAFSEEATLAEDRYGITARQVQVRSRGTVKNEQVILGVACRSGLQKVVVPFFEYGIPVEYELIRSISTVARAKKLRLGVAQTGAKLMGGFDMAGGQFRQIPRQPIVTELEKQYDVEQVNLAQPLDMNKYDVLLVVQPSSMGPIDMDNLINAIKQGQPVAVFEDPRPMFMQAPATGEPRPSPGGMMGRQQRPQPKGDIKKLWKTLGIKSQGAPDMRSGGFNPHIVFQYYNPYRKLGNVDVRFGLDQWLFISNHNPASDGSSCINNDQEITKGLVEVFLAVAGSIDKDRDGVNLDFTPLLSTAGNGASGYITYQNVLQTQGGNDVFKPFHNPEKSPRHVAARIQGDIEADDSEDAKKKAAGKKKDDKKKGDKKKDDKKAEPVSTGPKKLDVVYVADIDVLSGAFIQLRARRGDESEFIRWNFQNVTFVLNIIDSLAGESRYIPVRGRRPEHHTLQLVEEQVHQLQLDEEAKRKKLKRDTEIEIKKLNDDIKKINDEFEKKLEKLRADKAPREQIIALVQQFQAQQLLRTRRAKIETERLNRDSDKKKKRNERRMELAIERIQNRFKMSWVFGPLILPLVLGVVVFAQRRLREREGVSRNRLK